MKYKSSSFVELLAVDTGDHLPRLPFNRFPSRHELKDTLTYARAQKTCNPDSPK